MIRLSDIIGKVLSYHPNPRIELIEKAYVFSAQVHKGQLRLSGEPYLIHPLEVAALLADLKLDDVSVTTGLLHDTVEDTVSRGRIEFGGVVAQITQEKCSACLTCVRTCPYEAPYIGTASKAEIWIQSCQGCGLCVGICPSKAIELHNFTDDQITEEARVLLGGDF